MLPLCHRELIENKRTNTALDKKLKEATLSVEISAKQELVTALEQAQRTAQEEKEQLLSQIEELRLKVRQAEEQHSE
jgi:tRNA A-37 threonylcarbamoyl transferase component Bud32